MTCQKSSETSSQTFNCYLPTGIENVVRFIDKTVPTFPESPDDQTLRDSARPLDGA